MIKIPKAIVIYPQKKDVPGYLLCWIPAREYQRVVVGQEKRRELEKLYPQGIEVELSKDSLLEASIVLEVAPQQLRRAYLDLYELNLVPDSGLVELASLKEYLDQEQTHSRQKPAAKSVDQLARFDQLVQSGLQRKIASAPPMTEGDEEGQVYRRLDVEQRGSNQGDQGE
jgi:hypothetical protein